MKTGKWHHSLCQTPTRTGSISTTPWWWWRRPSKQIAESAEPSRSQRGNSRDVALGWVGLAAIQVAEGMWKEAKSSVDKGATINKMNV